MINNPANPNGTVYSEEHQMEIINALKQYKLPLILDEVYE